MSLPLIGIRVLEDIVKIIIVKAGIITAIGPFVIVPSAAIKKKDIHSILLSLPSLMIFMKIYSENVIKKSKAISGIANRVYLKNLKVVASIKAESRE